MELNPFIFDSNLYRYFLEHLNQFRLKNKKIEK